MHSVSGNYMGQPHLPNQEGERDFFFFCRCPTKKSHIRATLPSLAGATPGAVGQLIPHTPKTSISALQTQSNEPSKSLANSPTCQAGCPQPSCSKCPIFQRFQRSIALTGPRNGPSQRPRRRQRRLRRRACPAATVQPSCRPSPPYVQIRQSGRSIGRPPRIQRFCRLRSIEDPGRQLR